MLHLAWMGAVKVKVVGMQDLQHLVEKVITLILHYKKELKVLQVSES